MNSTQWVDWICRELRSMAHARGITEAVETISLRVRDRVLSEPHVWAVGGVLGVVPLLHEAAERLGRLDERLAALAAMVLLDPYRLGVADAVRRARAEADARRHHWS